MKLSARTIDGLRGEHGKPREISDDTTQGLYLRVSPSGVKSWMLRYTRADGTRAKFGIGRYPAIGLADARASALKVSAQVISGDDPARERTVHRRLARKPSAERPRTLADLWALYDLEVMPTKRASTANYQRWIWRQRLAPLLGFLDLDEVDRASVRVALQKIGVSGPTTANRALGLIRHMLNVAVDRDFLAASPVSRMTAPFKECSRDRVLKAAEIRKLWAALGAPDSKLGVSDKLGIAIKLALVTGARGIEIIGLHASELDPETRLWTIPAARFKGKRVHTVPLSPLAMRLLQRAFGAHPEQWSGFAFANTMHDDRHAERMSMTRAMQRIVEDIGIDRATPHDLRRTMATNMASERIGVAPHVITAVLGHAADGAAVTRIYNRHAYDREKRAALDAWAQLLETTILVGLDVFGAADPIGAHGPAPSALPVDTSEVAGGHTDASKLRVPASVIASTGA